MDSARERRRGPERVVDGSNGRVSLLTWPHSRWIGQRVRLSRVMMPYPRERARNTPTMRLICSFRPRALLNRPIGGLGRQEAVRCFMRMGNLTAFDTCSFSTPPELGEFTERGHLARRQPRPSSFARFVAWRVALRRSTLHAVIGVRDGHHVTAATERSASTRIGNVSSTRSGLNEM